MKFHIDVTAAIAIDGISLINVTAAIAIDGILTHKDTCNVFLPTRMWGQEGRGKSLIEERGGRPSLGRQRWQRRIQLYWRRV